MTLFAMLRSPGPLNAVLVTTRDGQSIKGVLVERSRDGLILRAASLAGVDPNGVQVWTKMVGDVVVPMPNVAFYQEALGVELLD